MKEIESSSEGNGKITEDWLIHNVLEFFLAGSDTNTVTIKWILLFMIKYPDVQKKVHQEIDDILGQYIVYTLQGECSFTRTLFRK